MVLDIGFPGRNGEDQAGTLENFGVCRRQPAWRWPGCVEVCKEFLGVLDRLVKLVFRL